MSWLSSLVTNPSSTLFLAFLFFLPSQLGKHFWPSFAFLHGLRVDYLSPTLYFTDVIILLLLLEMLPILLRKILSWRFLFLVLVVGLFSFIAYTSDWRENSLLGVVRLLETIFIGWLTAWFIQQKKMQKPIRVVLIITLLYSCLLAFLQVSLNHSVGGLWYWLGERSFSSLTPGIANASILGNLFLRPYATFPHPNVLAAFIVILSTFLLFLPQLSSRTSYRLLELGVMGFSWIVLGLTLSRAALIVMALVLVVWLWRGMKKRLQRLFFLCAMGVIILTTFILRPEIVSRFTSLSLHDEAVTVRQALAQEAVTIFSSQPVFGVGLQNFLPVLGEKYSFPTPLAFLQPVHSVYLLILSETGAVGVILFLSLITVSLYHIRNTHSSYRMLKIVLLLVFLLLSLFDHYFYTLHQGRLLTAFIFGVIFTPFVSNPPPFTPRRGKILRKKAKNNNDKNTNSTKEMKNHRKGTQRGKKRQK